MQVSDSNATQKAHEGQKVYPWCDTIKSIQYDVLHYLERGAFHGCHIVRMSEKTSRPLTSSQVRDALQVLRRKGLIYHDGRWLFVNAALREVQFAGR